MHFSDLIIIKWCCVCPIFTCKLSDENGEGNWLSRAVFVGIVLKFFMYTKASFFPSRDISSEIQNKKDHRILQWETYELSNDGFGRVKKNQLLDPL